MATVPESRPDLRVLIDEHAETVWRYAMGMLGDEHAADEVTNDTFARVHRTDAGWRGDSSVSTWLIAICRNLCIDRLRARREPAVPLDALPESALDPSAVDRVDPADRAVLRAVLSDGLGRLPDEQREAFLLVDVLGHTGVEAAEICDVPPTTLRSRLRRAHDLLVEHITGGAT